MIQPQTMIHPPCLTFFFVIQASNSSPNCKYDVFHVNYTFYGMHQKQDSVNVCMHLYIMVLAHENKEEEDKMHPYCYAKVLCIFHESMSGSLATLTSCVWTFFGSTGLDEIQAIQVASQYATFITLGFWTQHLWNPLDSSILVMSSKLFTSSPHFQLAECQRHQRIWMKMKTMQIGTFVMFLCVLLSEFAYTDRGLGSLIVMCL